MIVEIISCYDRETGENKNQRIIGNERELLIGKHCAVLKYTDGSFRSLKTSRIKRVEMIGDTVSLLTKNTVYTLKVVSIGGK